MSKFDFKIKFDVTREVFVMTVTPIHPYYNGMAKRNWKDYEAHALSTLPYTFRACIPFDEIPDGLFAIGAALPRGVQLVGLRFTNGKACFTFEFTDEALLQATPAVYLGWMQTVIKEGIGLDAFARE